MRKIDRLFFQAVDVGCLDVLVARITKRIKAPLVGQENQYVGLLGGVRGGSRQGEGQGAYGEESLHHWIVISATRPSEIKNDIRYGASRFRIDLPVFVQTPAVVGVVVPWRIQAEGTRIFGMNQMFL